MAKGKKKRKSSKKRAGRRFFSILALALLLCVGLVGVIYIQFSVRDVVPPPEMPTNIAVNFYFRNADGFWEQEERQIEESQNRGEMVQAVLQGLVEGPRAATLLPIMPQGVGVLDATLRVGAEENVLDITFTPNFVDATPLERIFATASFVWTLTELEFVHHLMFYAGDYPIRDGDGNIFGLRNRQNTTLEDAPPPWEVETAVIALYFPDDNMMGLVAEFREVPINPLQDIERAKVSALIDGPRDTRLFAIFPPDLSYNRVEVSDDTVTVDFTEEFLTGLGAGSLMEEMMIFSLVNTLTERPGIRRVQISIDGVQIQPDDDGEMHIDLSRPIERDESLIIQID